MVSHYGRIGDTSVNNPESHDMDSDSQDNYQEDVNDLEHIELNPPAEFKHLTHEMEWLRQTVEDRDKDPNGCHKAPGIKTQPVSFHTSPTHITNWGSPKQIYKHLV